MKWKDVLKEIEKGNIDPESELIVYDMSTGDELETDLIQFEDNGQVAIVINPDDDLEEE